MQTILAAALLVLVTSVSTYAQCTDADRKKFEEFDRAWGEAGIRGDRAFLQNVFADNFMGLSAGVPLTKAQSIDNTVRDFERNKANPEGAPKVTWDHYIIACTPSSATVTHRNTVTAKADGKEQTSFIRSVHVLEKRGDRWQVVSNAGHPLDDAGVLLYMERDWNDASKKRDAAWFERNFASDASDISSRTGEIHSKAEEIASMKNDKSVVESLELSELNVRIEGTAAVVTGVNHVKGRDEQGKPFDRRVRFTDTFIKRDGRWQVWATQGTPAQLTERR